MRNVLVAWLVRIGACLCPGVIAATETALEIELLDPSVATASLGAVTSGSLDSRFLLLDEIDVQSGTGELWLKLGSSDDFRGAEHVDRAQGASGERAVARAEQVLTIRKSRDLRMAPFAHLDGERRPLRLLSELPALRGMHEVLFLLPDDLAREGPLYIRIETSGESEGEARFAISTARDALAAADERARMIAMTFGALMAMALAALLTWFVLRELLLLLYAALFSLHALYMAYMTGHGFEWPILAYGLPLASHTWNVPAALSGAVASLFVREIAELARFSPRVYRAFGWLAVVFVALAFANLARHIGLGDIVAAIGNLIFVGAAAFTLIVAFMAWRRNNRAAGWFLIAWGLLETVTIATAIRLLVAGIEESAGLLYYGLPLSMVAAAVLIALGVADRLRDQRLALTDAERRARTDPLTGVLNRGSLLERLDAACLRARASGLPVALLFIDLDHFKEINDSFGHAAGDVCLKAIIGPIQAELRQSDVIGRYGGEEFVVILSSADVGAARPVAERIRKRIADVRVEGFGPPIHVTCSIGVATSDMLGVWGEHLIARADEAVYAAKRSGRNQVQVAAPLAA